MIIVMTTHEKDEIDGRVKLVTSHGIDEQTGKIIIMQPDHPASLGAVFDHVMGEWVIR